MKKSSSLTALLLLAATYILNGQMITGVWKGKINRQRVEVKIIQNGDNLAGTSYYYESNNNYRRYSIKGYFDPHTNEAVWWDDELLEDNSGRFSTPGKAPLLSRADFNCPGDGKMMLDGTVTKVEQENQKSGDVHLDKTANTNFPDEWDFVIDNYVTGANDPEIIDSVALVSLPKRPGQETIVMSNPLGQPEEITAAPQKIESSTPKIETALPPKPNVSPTARPLTIQEKFNTRKKVFNTEIPVSGDSIELRFYDNAQIDGDSISLFLNDKLIFEHIRLTEKAYVIKLPVTALSNSNELIMVAENLGSIPPNTSYMVALVEEKRYEARLESTEGSSALIRLVKKE